MSANAFQEVVYHIIPKGDGVEIRFSKTQIPSGILWEAQRWEMVDGQMRPVGKSVSRLFGTEEDYEGVMSKVISGR